MNLLRFFLLSLLLCGLLQNSAEAESFTDAEARLEDRAFLVTLEPGVRRARLIYKDTEDAEGSVISLVHLSGDDGFLKLRIPDNLPMDSCHVEVSFEDPFPYAVYEGETSFSQKGQEIAVPGGPLVDFDGVGAPEAGDERGGEDVVQESDLWQWRGRTLYFFNQLRGLQVFDLENAEDPQRVATLRLPASGDQMYLIDDEHVLLITQSFNVSHPWGRGYSAATCEALLIQHNGNSLRVQERFTFKGSYIESRLVGKRLYLVTQVYEPATEENDTWRQGLDVYGIDFSNPEAPESLPPLRLGEENSYFWNAIVSASSEYLIVSPSFYDEEKQMTRSRSLLIPIGADVESLEVSHTIELKAWLKDKFKLRAKDGILTTVTEQNNWRDTLQTYVESFRLDPEEGERQKLDEIILAPEEQLHATRFDGDRLYVVTFFVELMKDPLFVIDLSDPTNLKSLGELEIPGWSTYLEPMGDRLLSVGLEEGNVAVSLFDVENPSELALLERVYPSEGQSWSEATWDEKAIGFFPEENLLLIPMQSWEQNTLKNFVSLIDVHEDTVTLRGQIEHEVQGRRSKAFDELIVSISAQELLVVDAEDRDEPVLVAKLPLAWPADRVIAHGEYLFQFEEGNLWSTESQIRLRISPSSDSENVIANVRLGAGTLLGAEIEEEILYVLSSARRVDPVQEESDDEADDGSDANGQLVGRTELILSTYDLADPTSPMLLDRHVHRENREVTFGDYEGRLLDGAHFVWTPEVTRSQEHGYFRWGWGGVADLAVDALWFPYPPGSRWFDTAAVFVYDVSDTANTELISRTALNTHNANAYGESVFRDDHYYFSYETYHYEDILWHRQSYLQTVDLINPAEPLKSELISIPGLIENVHVVRGGTLLFTTGPDAPEENGDFYYSEDQALHASAFDGTKAFLIDTIILPGGRYSATSAFGSYLFKPRAEGIAVYGWDDGDNNWTKEEPIALESQAMALEVVDGRLFAQSGNTLEVVAVDQLPGLPQSDSFTFNGQTYGTRFDRIVLNDDRSLAWLPLGAYGVDTFDVSGLANELPLRVAAQNSEEWHIVAEENVRWVRASGEDSVGALADDQESSVRLLAQINDYESWVRAHFDPAHDDSTTLPDPDDDLDGDGMSILEEFVFNTNPRDSRSTSSVSLRILNGPDGKRYLSLDLPAVNRLDQVQMTPQISDDLSHWGDATDRMEMDGGEALQLRLLDSVEVRKAQYIRLRFALPEEN